MRLLPLPAESSKGGKIVYFLKLGLPLVCVAAIAIFTALFFALKTSTGVPEGDLHATCSVNGVYYVTLEYNARYVSLRDAMVLAI